MAPPGSDLKHKPFAALRTATVAVGAAPASPPVRRASASGAMGRVVVREEHDEAERADVTRVIGVSGERLDGLGKRWREALGRTVLIEGRDLLVMGSEAERLAGWLREAGATEVVVVRRAPRVDLTSQGEAGGTQRAQIRRGVRVAIVLKADQATGELTEGVVQDILTSSPTHPRGIKVRLTSGQVGRVRRLLAP